MRWVLRLLLIGLLGLLAPAPARSAPLPAMQTAPVFGRSIRYYDVGSGPAIVLVHGLGSTAHFDWGRVIGPLAEHHRVIALDQLGFGGSDKPLIDYSVQTWVDFLGEFLRGLEVEHFALAGGSLGGWVAVNYTIEALAADPAAHGAFALPRPDHLILIDAAGHSPRPGAERAEGLNPSSLAATRAFLGRLFFNQGVVTDTVVRESFTSRVGSGASYTAHAFLANPLTATETVDGRLGAITIPTLILWGAADQVLPAADGRDFERRIPGAKLILLERCGHLPTVEQPAAVTAAVLAFLGPRP